MRSSSSRSPSAATISVRRSSPFAYRSLISSELLADEAVDTDFVGEDRAELGDALLKIGVLLLDSLALEPGEALEAEVENRLCLDLGELEALLQAGARFVGVGRSADERDDFVEVVEGGEIALEDVGALLRLAKLELGAPRDDDTLEVEVVPDELEERKRPRDPVHERDGVVAEGRLERGVLVELVEDDLRDRLALELDLDAHPRLVRVVRQVGDLGENLVVRELGDLLDDAAVAALLHPVRELA